ncbi:MAG: multiheme c-type cytochrome [Planctomycetota bacterium]
MTSQSLAVAGAVSALLGIAGWRIADVVALEAASVRQAEIEDAEAEEKSSPPPQPERDPLAPLDGAEAVLLLTGEVYGYLEPCGCSANQSGGVARRSSVFKTLEARGLPVAAVDLGGSVRRSRKQTEFKFTALQDAMRDLGYRAMGLGVEELRFSPGFLISQHLYDSEWTDRPLSFLGANVIFYDVPDLDGGPRKYEIVDAGPFRVGVTAVIGDSLRDTVLPDGAYAEFSTVPPGDVLPGVIDELEAAGVDQIVLLAYADAVEAADLATSDPRIDVVVSALGPEDPDPNQERLGDQWLLRAGHKGKHVVLLGLSRGEDGRVAASPATVEVSGKLFEHDAAMDLHMATYQTNLNDAVYEVFDDIPAGDPPGGGAYVGAETCGNCHRSAYEKWASSRHSLGYASLSEGRHNFEGDWVPRSNDPECLSCHVTGWNPQEYFPYTTGFLPEQIAEDRGTPDRFHLLQGNQCENCHGPGERHATTMKAWLDDKNSVPRAEFAVASRMMELTLAEARDEICLRCHDVDNSPHFDFDTYWPKVAHPGKDIDYRPARTTAAADRDRR